EVARQEVEGEIQAAGGLERGQRDDLERQLKADFPDGFDGRLLARFVEAVEEVADGLEYDDLEEVCIDRRDPLVIYLRFNDKQMAEILDHLAADAAPAALRLLRQFIKDNSEGDDVMNLLARKAFAVRDDPPLRSRAAGR
ncbi:MAG: hypothetical protein Q8R92_18955, partial [Deltaproteobacteria bacterium]|nr:hypothetical protein [Deltaproteobacteria bacterium]